MNYKVIARRLLYRLDAHLSLRTIADRIAEGLREIALLWFVFANLDIIVQTSHFSWAWSIKNTIGTFVLWSLGAVLEALLERKGAGQWIRKTSR
ncbi:MAG TPA: hypothetical protein VHY33_04900 [Thermoanaerobaculia bacterium]|jgi:hypothetical protein|nr:hypothetical protein [Thermoanaerobaculia bacterium]